MFMLTLQMQMVAELKIQLLTRLPLMIYRNQPSMEVILYAMEQVLYTLLNQGCQAMLGQ